MSSPNKTVQALRLEIDAVQEVLTDAEDWIANFADTQRAKGVKGLSLGFNYVRGYYIELPRRPSYEMTPHGYKCVQRLVTTDRYITLELKQWECVMHNARARLETLRGYLAAAVAELDSKE
jgi:DNA mismatch repair protein MutS